MKKIILSVLIITLWAGSALAMGIGGRAGVTLRGGVVVPADQAITAPSGTVDTSVGYTFGGGLIYGINNNISAEIEVLHSSFEGDLSSSRTAKFELNDISIGGDYRFLGTAPMMQRAVPYVGAGVDIIVGDVEVNGVSADKVDPAVGGHIKVGSDLFVSSHVALNVELRGVLATEGSVYYGGSKIMKLDGSGFQGLFGARVFF